MADLDKRYIFEEAPIPRAVASLAIPTVISYLVTVLYSLADTYFVGMLNDPIESAAVSISYPMMLSFSSVINLFGAGCSSLMSRSLGARDYETARRASSFGIWGSLAAALLISSICVLFREPVLFGLGADETTFAAADRYMSWAVAAGAAPSIVNVVMGKLVGAEGATVHASFGTMLGCVLNMIIDPFFILPEYLGLGAAGAGLATFISNCVACVYFFALCVVRRGRSYVSVSPLASRPTRDLVWRTCVVGVPAAIQNLLNVSGQVVLNNLMSPFGASAVAAIGIAQKIDFVPFQISLGFTQGVMPLVGYNFASRNSERMRSAIRFTLVTLIPLLVAVTVCIAVFRTSVMGMFIKDPEVVRLGSTFLATISFSIPFASIDFAAIGVFQALGKGQYSLIFALLRKVILEIPALLLLNKLMPMYGLAWARTCTELVLAAAAVFMLRYIFKNAETMKR